MKKKTVALVLVLLLAISLAACGNSEEFGGEGVEEKPEYQWTFTTALVPEHALSQGIVKFAELLEQESQGRISVNLQLGGVLGGDVDLMEQLSAGLIAAHSTTIPFAANYVPELGVFDLPYLFEDTSHVKAVVESDLYKGMINKLEGTGIKVLTDFYFGYRTLSANKEIRVPEDMKGIKIRLTETEIMLAMFKAVGAIPTPMAFSELYTALQQNTVDAQENPYFVILLNSFDEVQKYVITTEHCYSIGELYFSEQVWNQLNEEDKNLVLNCAKEAKEWQYDYGEELALSATNKLKERGKTTVIELTSEEKAEWKKAMTSIYEDFYNTYGKDNIEAIVNYGK